MGIVSMIGVIMGFILIMTSSANHELSKRFLFRRRDPEIKMNASQLITSKGYPCENHEVQTTDGFILGVQRIPHGIRDSQAGNRPVVLLQHGLLASSTCWLENLANQSLGYILADAGYDVWLGNSRGNTYGKRHIHYQPKQRKFWAWSWDEMAKYDLPDTINYVLRVSGQSQLYYVGHSQGTEIAFAEFSRNYELGRKVKTFFALAPVMKVGHMDSPLILLFPFMSGLHAVLNFFGHNEFLPSNVIMHFLASIVCPVGSLTHHLCDNILFLFGGYNSKQMNSTRIPVYIGHNPAGTSIQNMMHYAQSFKSNKFQMYDFGSSSKNIQHHGQTLPPLYDVSQMETPVAMFYGSVDSFADLTDVKAMLPKLKNVVLNKEIHDWMHLDFIWAMDAPTTCYSDILTIMAQREMAANATHS